MQTKANRSDKAKAVCCGRGRRQACDLVSPRPNPQDQSRKYAEARLGDRGGLVVMLATLANKMNLPAGKAINLAATTELADHPEWQVGRLGESKANAHVA